MDIFVHSFVGMSSHGQMLGRSRTGLYARRWGNIFNYSGDSLAEAEH